jgi:DNA gyrase subunit A
LHTRALVFSVTVIKVDEGDRVVAFLTAAPNDKEARLELETEKGRTLTLSPTRYGVTGRGGKGHEMSRKDMVKSVKQQLVFIPLPEKKD